MKYYNLIILFAIAVAFPLHAQNTVGVGTANPQGTLHIDAAKNTSGASDTEDDVIVSTSGNVGVGTLNPSSALDVNGNVLVQGNDSVTGNDVVTNSFVTGSLKYGSVLSSPPKAKLDIETSSAGKGLRLSNGTQTGGSNFIPVLGVDASGNATWKNLQSVTSIVSGGISVGTRILNSSASSYYTISSPNVTIPSGGGLWLIYAKVIVGNYAATATANTYGTARKDIYMYLRNGTTDITSTMVYPETTGSCIGILQLTHMYYAGDSNASAVTLNLAVKSDHVETGSSTSGNTRYSAYQTYGGSFWTDPVFFAIRIDYTN